MASIIKDELQLQALEEIESALKVIRQVNQITAEGANGVFSIIFTPTDGKGITVMCEEEEKKLKDILVLKKDRLVKDIKLKSKKYRIQLSKEDYEDMGEKEE